MKLKRVLKWGIVAIGGAIALAALAIFIAYWVSDNECDTVAQGGMQAVVYCEYGSAEVLRLERVEKPVPDDEVLVRVRAAAINPLDWHYMRGTPYVMRLTELNPRDLPS
jgi:hypothetical protein